MEEYFDILQRCTLFHGIAEADLATMLDCLGATVKRFCKKAFILSEGEPVRAIGILLTGAAQVERTDYFGNRSIVAGLEPAELFGESFACAGVDTMPVDVVATEDATVLFIECQRVTYPCCHACGFHQRMIYNLMRVVARKNLVFRQKIEITSKRTTREKLMTYLLVQAKKAGSNRFTIPYDRQQLADYLAVDRSGLSAEIGKLRREGVLTSERNQFTLLRDE